MTTLASQPMSTNVGALEVPREDCKATLTPTDLAELISSFTEVTGRLQSTHEILRAEVARLESELREAQNQLRRTRQLAALGEMAAGIAHEVRNPLGSIRLYASALAQDLSDRPAEQSLATRIGAAVGRLNAVVGDVLTFARDQVVRAEDVEAGELIREAIDACADQWRLHGIEVSAPDARSGRLWIRCDHSLAHQALVNILRNAAEAVGDSDGGIERRVRIRVERRDAVNADGARNRMIAIVVEDSGPGIPPEALERLFNPFFTTRHTGTGLGLAIVHRIVDAHGGRVSIRNNAGISERTDAHGACVEVLLPAAETDNFQEEAIV